MKLSIPQFHVGTDKAEKYILQLCEELKIPTPKKRDRRKVFRITSGESVTEINFENEIEYVKKNGKANVLQMMLDANDRFLNTPLSLGILGDGCGIKMNLRSEYGGHTSSIQFPGVIEAPEVSFADDISYFRHEAVRTFNNNDLSGFSRSYRGFLQSGISLIDCFLHRYTFHVKNIIPSTEDYINTAIMDSRKPIEDRLDSWMVTFAAHKIDEYKNSKHRSKFIELKRQRNSIVHASNPSVPYGAKEVVKYLNYAQDGIGGFLAELRRYSGYSENIGFIRQIKTQPVINIRKSKNKM